MKFAPYVILLISLFPLKADAKTASVIVTAEMRRNAMRNAEAHPWAQRERDALVRRVAPYMAMTDEQLWHLPPSQDMPRDSGLNHGEGGCPNCGREHFKAPYNPSRWHFDLLNEPWRAQCRNCKVWLPSNDFDAYYRSSLDEQGKFRQGQGDPQYLKTNATGPAAQWIDDGTGIRIGKDRWFPAAFYAFRLWTELLDVTEAMAKLYTLTEDPQYAYKAGVLLDRIADLYPEMNYKPHYRMGMEASTGGSGDGRIQGKIWETWTAQKLSLAYDYIFDALMQDQELVSFSQTMSQRYRTGDKSSPQSIARHIEDNLLLEFVKGIQDRRIHGNAGMHQYAMAAAAIALDRPGVTGELLDWLFMPENPAYRQEPFGGAIPTIMQQQLCREGLSDEAGLGYASIPIGQFVAVADMLRHYSSYTKHDLYRDYPKFRAAFTVSGKVRIAEHYTPNHGDGDKCMNGVGGTGRVIDLKDLIIAYRAYGDPAIAREIWYANRRTFDGLRGDIYDADPTSLAADMASDFSGDLPPLRSFNTGGYGMAILHAPQQEQPRGVSLYYGRMGGHGHMDRLAINMAAHDVNMVPDMGYPLYTGTNPARVGWVNHIVSHNTVMVNDTVPSTKSWSGKMKLFGEEGPVRVVDVDGDANIYNGVSTYRRCLVMVDVDEVDSYIVDLFWVRGGTTHRLIQNGGGPEVTHSGLPLVAQMRGTYAGENVEFGEFYDGEVAWTYAGSGLQFLKRVERTREAKPLRDFWVDWKMVEPRRRIAADWEAHLRVHNLGMVDEVGLADGIPPEYTGNPPSLRYLLRTRRGRELNTQFISVLEPYGKTPVIQSVRLLKEAATRNVFMSAVEVTLVDGRRDVILVRETPGPLSAGGVSLEGRVGFARLAGDQPQTLALFAGTKLQAVDQVVTLPIAVIQGRLVSFTDTDPTDVRLKINPALPGGVNVTGRYVIIDNTERSDASYMIESVPDSQTLAIGATSLVERLVDPLNYNKGVIRNIAANNRLSIPLSASWNE